MPATDRELARYLRLVKKGLTLERSWDRAVAAGDRVKMAMLNKAADAYYRALDKYEGKGLVAYLDACGEVVAVAR